MLLHRGDKLAANTVQFVRVYENDEIPRPSVRAFGLLAWLALTGFTMGAVFGPSHYYDGGTALLATAMLSLLSTNTGITNKRKPSPNDPKPDPHSPTGDVVINTRKARSLSSSVMNVRQGTCISVQAKDASTVYAAGQPTEVSYLLAHFLLMGGVICLANATIQLQTGFAASYMVINICYWIGAAPPPTDHWNLTRLTVLEIRVEDERPPPGSARWIRARFGVDIVRACVVAAAGHLVTVIFGRIRRTFLGHRHCPVPEAKSPRPRRLPVKDSLDDISFQALRS
jgi:hypothetical protein